MQTTLKLLASITLVVSACTDASEPSGNDGRKTVLPGDQWILESYNGQQLPVKPNGMVAYLVADTLQLNIRDAEVADGPLARSRGTIEFDDGARVSTGFGWWHYVADSERAFSLRSICNDVIITFASCIDLSARGTIDGDRITLRYTYGQVQTVYRKVN